MSQSVGSNTFERSATISTVFNDISQHEALNLGETMKPPHQKILVYAPDIESLIVCTNRIEEQNHVKPKACNSSTGLASLMWLTEEQKLICFSVCSKNVSVTFFN